MQALVPLAGQDCLCDAVVGIGHQFLTVKPAHPGQQADSGDSHVGAHQRWTRCVTLACWVAGDPGVT